MQNTWQAIIIKRYLWPRITDFSGLSIYGLKAKEKEMSTLHSPEEYSTPISHNYATDIDVIQYKTITSNTL